MASITAPGVGSGLDINNLVSQLIAAEGEPASVRLARQESDTQARISALGSLKGALSSFRSGIASLGKSSTFTGRSASSGNEERFTASATSSAVAGVYDIEVQRLAATHKIASPGLASADTAVGTGTLSIAMGASSFQVPVSSGSDDLAGIRDAINASSDNPGVRATLVTVDDTVNGGSMTRLVLTSGGTGSADRLSITADDDDLGDTDGAGLSRLFFDPDDVPGSQASELQAPDDALVFIDQQQVSSSTNRLEGVIEGVTVDLVEAAPGETDTLSVGVDTDAVLDEVRGFVSAFNTLNVTLSGLSAFNAETGQAGLLLGDATLRNATSVIRRELGVTVGAAPAGADSLASIGITTDANGNLVLDESAFKGAAAGGLDGLQALFSSDNGIATRLNAAIEPYVQTNGTIDSRTQSLDGRIDRIDEQREALSRRLDSMQTRLLNQFIAMDQLVGNLQSTGGFIDQQLGALRAQLNGNGN